MAVAVVISDGRSHARLLASVFVKRSASGDSYVGKSPVVIVAIKNAGRAVAGDENVGPTVFVEIQRRNTESIMAVGAVDMGLRRDVFKRSVAAVVVKDVFCAGQSARATHDRNPLPNAGWTLARRGGGRQIKVHIVGDNQIETPVAIVVNECATGPPGLARSRNAGLFCDLGEHSVVVVIEAILAVISDVEIFPSVVVVVADANALSPAGRGEARFRRHVGESAVMVIVIETIARTLPGGKSLEPCAIHQKNVGPAVVVVVEDRDAGSCGLDDVFLGVDAAEDFLRGQAGLFCDVGETRDRRSRRSGRLRLLGAD